jgi:putative membrane protein
MKEFIVKLAVNLVSLELVMRLLPGIYVDGWQATVAAAAALTLVNIFLKPAVIAVTLPINVMSLGFFTFFVNALMFYLVSRIVPGFNVSGFRAAFWGAMVLGVLNFLLNILFIPGKKRRISFRFGSGSSKNAPREKYRDLVDAEATEEKNEIEDGKERKEE